MQSPLQAVAPWFEAQTEKDVVYDFFREEFWPDEAYLVFANNFNRQIELSNGKVVILPMPTLLHQRLSKRLFKMLDLRLAEHELGEALYAPHPIRLWPGKYREPDIVAWIGEHRDRMGEQESGPPDLAVEIVSPGNEPHVPPQTPAPPVPEIKSPRPIFLGRELCSRGSTQISQVVW